MTDSESSNALINESSPYLLQHAYNPVDWMPYNDTIFEFAERQHKLVILSIGYSSCHWCHVMEHESFEDSTVADLMNRYFISVKIDREERPDVDAVYMTAVQLMTNSGGWPLNVVCLPDGRPIWGGTYFPKEQWMESLRSIQEVFESEPDKVEEYAERLHEGILQSESLIAKPESDFNYAEKELLQAAEAWTTGFDTIEGGAGGAPKFPLPNNYAFLLEHAHFYENKKVAKQVELTLDKMAFGGIYDQVGGGFARYAVDDEWKVPHFEKMLYDNAQLVSLYSQAWQKIKKPLYKNVVYQTLEWVEREMTSVNGTFYSALDADSEGEEGRFYVWTEMELRNLIPENEWQDFMEYFDLNKGKWEEKIILLRTGRKAKSAEALKSWNKILMKARSKRVRPGLDDKSLTSWNALMLSAYVDAYKAFGEEKWKQIALKNAEWIWREQFANGVLKHAWKDDKSYIDGLLEDYVFSSQAFIDLYEIDGDKKWLLQAEQFMNYAQQNFKDDNTGLFYTRSLKSAQLIAKSFNYTDNVMPSENSVAAKVFLRLYAHLGKPEYKKQVDKMIAQLPQDRMLTYGESFSNWLSLIQQRVVGSYEVAIIGDNAIETGKKMQQHYLPNVAWAISTKPAPVPLLQDRFVQGETLVYVCEEQACKLPVETSAEALELLKK